MSKNSAAGGASVPASRVPGSPVASPHPFKRMEVCDLFSPERVATFARPLADSETIVINTHGASDFHLDAGTLKVVADVLGLPAI